MSPGPIALVGILACGVGSAGAGPLRAGSRSIPLTVEPGRVEIGLFYSGVDLAVSAETAPGVEVAVLVTGPSSELVLREQARRWGLFWAPAGEVAFEEIPSLYLLRTTVGLGELAPAPVLEELGIGYASLGRCLRRPRQDDLARELILLKESEGLFSSTVMRDRGRGGSSASRSAFRAVVHIPARAPAATYSVRLFAFRDGKLATRGEGAFELEQGDFVAFVSSLARTHGLAYGIFAVVVAVAAGLAVGFLFGSTRKKA